MCRELFELYLLCEFFYIHTACCNIIVTKIKSVEASSEMLKREVWVDNNRWIFEEKKDWVTDKILVPPQEHLKVEGFSH